MIKRYRSKRYGRLVVDFDRHEVLIDSLKRDRIWRDSERDYENQSYIYSEIIHELFGDDCARLAPPRPGRDEIWAGDPTDFGYRAFLADGWVFQLDAEGSYFWDWEEKF